MGIFKKFGFGLKKTREGTIELTVGYIAYNDWAADENNDFSQPEPAKYRKITLRRSDSGYYVSAIQNADVAKGAVNEISTSAAQTTQQTLPPATTTTSASSATTAQTKTESGNTTTQNQN